MRRYDFLFQITVYLSQTHKRKKQIDLSVDKKFVWILVSNYIILHVTQTHKRNKQIDKSVKRTTFLNTWMLKNRTHNMTSYKAWLFHKNLKCKKVYLYIYGRIIVPEISGTYIQWKCYLQNSNNIYNNWLYLLIQKKKNNKWNLNNELITKMRTVQIQSMEHH